MKIILNYSFSDHDLKKYVFDGNLGLILLGKEKEYFLPQDGKSPKAIEYYRWYHDRAFVVNRLFSIFGTKDELKFLAQALADVLDQLYIEDNFVALDVLSSIIGVIFYERGSPNDLDLKQIFKQLKPMLNRYLNSFLSIPKDTINVHNDFPGDISKLFIRMKKNFDELGRRYNSGKA